MRTWICARWSGTWIKDRGVWEGSDLSLEDITAPLTELTLLACQILFSASLNMTRLWTKKGGSAVTCCGLTHQVQRFGSEDSPEYN